MLGRTHDPHATERSRLHAAVGAADQQLGALDEHARGLERQLAPAEAVRDERDGLDRRSTDVQHQLRVLCDELAEQHVTTPPAWARQMFGPRPEQPTRAEHYDRGVRAVARYRIEHQVPDTTPELGPEPPNSRARSAWRNATRVAEQTQRRLGRDVSRDRDIGLER